MAVHGGLPALQTSLQWAPGCGVYVLGAYAALQLGPGAGNLAGAKTASVRWVDHLMKTAGHETWLQQLQRCRELRPRRAVTTLATLTGGRCAGCPEHQHASSEDDAAYAQGTATGQGPQVDGSCLTAAAGQQSEEARAGAGGGTGATGVGAALPPRTLVSSPPGEEDITSDAAPEASMYRQAIRQRQRRQQPQRGR